MCEISIKGPACLSPAGPLAGWAAGEHSAQSITVCSVHKDEYGRGNITAGGYKMYRRGQSAEQPPPPSRGSATAGDCRRGALAPAAPPPQQALGLRHRSLLPHLVQHRLQAGHDEAKGGALQGVGREDRQQQLGERGVAAGRHLRVQAAVRHLRQQAGTTGARAGVWGL